MELAIRPLETEEHAAAFRSLNEEWIERSSSLRLRTGVSSQIRWERILSEAERS